jgi:hypothetical protein
MRLIELERYLPANDLFRLWKMRFLLTLFVFDIDFALLTAILFTAETEFKQW